MFKPTIHKKINLLFVFFNIVIPFIFVIIPLIWFVHQAVHPTTTKHQTQEVEINLGEVEDIPGTIKQYIKKNINPDFKGEVSETPSYNSNKYSDQNINSPIKNPPDDIKAIYFDKAERNETFSPLYILEELKKMGNGADKMYLFKAKKKPIVWDYGKILDYPNPMDKQKELNKVITKPKEYNDLQQSITTNKTEVVEIDLGEVFHIPRAIKTYIKQNIKKDFIGEVPEKPSYNSNSKDFFTTNEIDSSIQNPNDNIKAIYFDGGQREKSSWFTRYDLEDLKTMGNGANKMYIFKAVQKPFTIFHVNIGTIGDETENIRDFIKTKINPDFIGYVSETPSYNADSAFLSENIDTPIKNPGEYTKAVYFDGGKRFKSFLGTHYTLEELKRMGDGAKAMYIFHNDSAELKEFELVLVSVASVKNEKSEKKLIYPLDTNDKKLIEFPKNEKRENINNEDKPKLKYNYN
ncbi:hypothetical protein [Candidatus Phytoplasma pruni]|uniref:Uncharacterized protein n=1 Tax=Candidatus Phytoplasma pruni TaxID=479893 RepID=A0A851HJ23_9MOLU|nr:hypothetical protein [Candidatus Phytoplasma pruni]NWN45823.1 hypothetical protein [Candidatus Phytoplasma pruni]